MKSRNGPQAIKDNYALEVDRLFKPSRRKRSAYTALDLYAGAGGLSLGLETAGLAVTGIDCNPDCCDTYNANLAGRCINEFVTPKYDFPRTDIIVGGPPCQPFSVRGRQMGILDGRNGIPGFVSAVRKIVPRMFVFENVKGLMYRNKQYFEETVTKLQRMGYRISVQVVNCADYGVPQNRERVIVVGSRGGKFDYPAGICSTHSQVTAGEALRNIPASRREKPQYLTTSMDRYIAVYESASKCVRPRDLHMNRPARTLTCRNLAGRSSDMHRIVTRNGKRRLLYGIEASRLQSFPDRFCFSGSKTSALNQIGNAVPPLFALVLGKQIIEHLDEQMEHS